MAKWIEDCKAEYAKTKNEKKYIDCLLHRIEIQEKHKNLQKRGVKALFELTKEQGYGRLISIQDLRNKSGISRSESQSCGLWGWVEAGVVSCFYKVNENFYSAIEQSLDDRSL